jgi:glycerol-3-phosphate dehydrogenase
MNEFDVIVIGGGITGAGTARDCALRGLKVLLVERFDMSTGATGRNHGLLHSGARYAVTDRESAAECIAENKILRKIAPHCIDPTGGLFITLPDDDLNYQSTFVEACKAAGIEAEIIDPREALAMEPSANREMIGAVKVPDASVDPFRLCASNLLDAKLHGAKILLYTEVTGFIIEGGRVMGIKTRNNKTGEEESYYAKITVNAAGIWGMSIMEKAGITVGMFPSKGALLIFAHRVNRMVLNRCRKPANADILVPGNTVSIIGTTSTRVPLEDCNNPQVTPDEVDLLIGEGVKLSPTLAETRILRAFAGVRPLVSADSDPSGRSISRGAVCLDHAKRDGMEGLVTITGGKLTTYRLMAEMATDMVCRKLGIHSRCQTAWTPLPGAEGHSFKETADTIWRTPGNQPEKTDIYGNALVCECENISVGEIQAAIQHLGAGSLVDLRRRTRMGMGTCQGELCGCRAARILAGEAGTPEKAMDDLRSFMAERWKGIYPIAWGDALREAEYTQWVYKHVLGI